MAHEKLSEKNRWAMVAAVRVVLAEERWTERHCRAGRSERVARTRHWRWLVTAELDEAEATVIWRIGHQRWGVANHAVNELTQHYHPLSPPRGRGDSGLAVDLGAGVQSL